MVARKAKKVERMVFVILHTDSCTNIAFSKRRAAYEVTTKMIRNATKGVQMVAKCRLVQSINEISSSNLTMLHYHYRHSSDSALPAVWLL